MATDFYVKAAELASSGKPFAVATVVRVEGSSSAKRGSKALIDHEGKIAHGWVGGGCAESAVRTGAVSCMEKNASVLLTLDMTDEVLGVGMPCGGKMDVFIEPVLPKPELLIVGHGRIAETLAGLASLLHFTVTVNDPGANRESFPTADRLVTRDFDLSQNAHRSEHVRRHRHAAQGRSSVAAKGAREGSGVHCADRQRSSRAHRPRLPLGRRRPRRKSGASPFSRRPRSRRANSRGNRPEHPQPDRGPAPWRHRETDDPQGIRRREEHCRTRRAGDPRMRHRPRILIKRPAPEEM